MDIDLAAPPIVVPDSRPARPAGSTATHGLEAVDAPIRIPATPRTAVPAPVPAPVPAGEAASHWVRADVAATGSHPALLPRVRAETRLLDNQLYAAARLVGTGLATRVVLVNAAVDSALPDDWEILGTPIHLSRLPDGRAVVTAGTRRG
jgi:hypothetical protein